jgi:hypothetical protein
MPTTGWPTTKDIGQAGLFASSVAQSRPSTILGECSCRPTRTIKIAVLGERLKLSVVLADALRQGADLLQESGFGSTLLARREPDS